MISILSWNLRGHQTATWEARAARLQTHIGRLVARHDVDILILIESRFIPAEVNETLNRSHTGQYHNPPSDNRHLQLFTRLPPHAVIEQFNDNSDGRLTIRRVHTPANNHILLAAIHFQSQNHWTSADQALQATVTQRDILLAEDRAGHQRTLLIGDLNMNPFDSGLVGAQALHAVMTRDLARREQRIVAGQPHRMFYNPMWGHFGDRTPGPPGTYYYQGSRPHEYYWHLFDQVLLRPELIDALSDLRILEDDGQESLLNAHRRPREEVSDHLPLWVRLDI